MTFGGPVAVVVIGRSVCADRVADDGNAGVRPPIRPRTDDRPDPRGGAARRGGRGPAVRPAWVAAQAARADLGDAERRGCAHARPRPSPPHAPPPTLRPISARLSPLPSKRCRPRRCPSGRFRRRLSRSRSRSRCRERRARPGRSSARRRRRPRPRRPSPLPSTLSAPSMPRPPRRSRRSAWGVSASVRISSRVWVRTKAPRMPPRPKRSEPTSGPRWPRRSRAS